MLQVTHLSKSFDKLIAVNGVSLQVPHGKIVGLIGPNGSGKSTLFNLLAGAAHADAGNILFDGQDITKASPDHIFSLGLVRSYQDPQLFLRMSTLDNAQLPIKGQQGEQVRLAPWHGRWHKQEASFTTSTQQLLQRLLLGQQASTLDNAQLPIKGQQGEQVRLAPWHGRWHKQETTLTTGTQQLLQRLLLGQQASTLAANLSGGQMKLLELARSLNGSPKMLLLDEPTAGVAPTLAREIFERIAQLRSELGLGIFVIEHRLEILFDYADEIYVMHLGQVIAHGSPAEVAANAQVKEIYFGD